MSIDFYLYLKEVKPNKNEYERYAKEQGFQIKIDPKINLMTDEGFCPICFIDERFINEKGEHAFMTGFELYHDDFIPMEPSPTVSKKILGIFRKQKFQESPFDMAIKDSSTVLTVSCNGENSFEVLMAYILGAYCVKYCDAVFDDPQSGCFYKNEKDMEVQIRQIVEAL